VVFGKKVGYGPAEKEGRKGFILIEKTEYSARKRGGKKEESYF